MKHIPAQWDTCKLKDVALIGDGAHASIQRIDKGILYLTSKNFGADRLDLSKVDYIAEDDYNKYFKTKSKALTKPEADDILLGIIGTLGAPYLVKKDDFFGLSSSVSIIRPNSEKLSSNYLYYWFKTPLFQNAINQIKSGVAQSFLSLAMIGSLPCVYPQSIEAQQKIAAILSAYDDLIENNLKQIKLLEELAQITYEEWFVRLKFPGHETTPKDFETGLPVRWEMVKVGDLLSKIKSTTKIKSTEYFAEGRYPIIDQGREYIAGYTNCEDSIIDEGNPIIVFGDHTRVLKFVNFIFARGADGTQVLLSKEERMPQHLFYFSLIAVDLSNYHYARHFKFLKDCEIMLPDIKTAQLFEDFVSKNFDLIKNFRNQNKLLKEARDILLPRLLTGMIDVDQLDLPELFNITPSDSTEETQAA